MRLMKRADGEIFIKQTQFLYDENNLIINYSFQFDVRLIADIILQ